MLEGLLVLFFVVGLLQVVLAPRLVDMIHGGPGRRGPRGRSLDVLVMRGAGGFMAGLAGITLAVLLLASRS